MNVKNVRTDFLLLMQHPRAPLVLALLALTLLLGLAMSWWNWQVAAQKTLVQARVQQQQLQSIIMQLPSNAALVLGSDAMMASLSRHPLPASLQGKVSDIRVVNDQLKGQINQASATVLFDWLNQLSQSGLLVSKLELTRTELDLVSGSVIWGN
jgi:hypothetical protein